MGVSEIFPLTSPFFSKSAKYSRLSRHALMTDTIRYFPQSLIRVDLNVCEMQKFIVIHSGEQIILSIDMLTFAMMDFPEIRQPKYLYPVTLQHDDSTAFGFHSSKFQNHQIFLLGVDSTE